MQKVYSTPLFGAPALPALTLVQERLRCLLFNSGSRYLGDESSLVRPPPPAAATPTLQPSGGSGPRLPGTWGLSEARSFPWIELAVMGRSNAGKSTLLNTLLHSKSSQQQQQQQQRHGLGSFVPVSKTPGTTVRLDFYGVGQAESPLLVLVDTPGYGYSAKGKDRHGVWMERMAEYLRTRRTMSSGPSESPLLARVMLLADARVGLTELDHTVLQALDESRLPTHVVLTKADLVGPARLATAAQAVARALRAYKMPFPHLNLISAHTGEGMLKLQHAIMHTTKLHRLSTPDFEEHRKELAEREAKVGAAAPA